MWITVPKRPQPQTGRGLRAIEAPIASPVRGAPKFNLFWSPFGIAAREHRPVLCVD
jgi:hypothetical protein